MQTSPAFEAYFSSVSASFPRITEFLDTFLRSKKLAAARASSFYSQTTQSQAGCSSRASTGVGSSNATSGISSMQPTKRRRSSRRTK